MNWQRPVPMVAGMMLGMMLAVGPVEARPRIGFLTLSAPPEGASLVAAFVDGLRRLGYAEGRSVDIDYRYAAGDVERLKPLRRNWSRSSRTCW